MSSQEEEVHRTGSRRVPGAETSDCVELGCVTVQASGWIYSWPEMNSLPDISPVKTGLFRIRRELLFGASQPWWAKGTFPPDAWRRSPWLWGTGSWEAIVNRGHGFSWAESWPGEKSHLPSFSWALLSSEAMSAPTLVTQLCLIEFSVYWFFTLLTWKLMNPCSGVATELNL